MSVIDTNVLVHVSATASPDHPRAVAALARLAAQGPVAVTRQNLREFLSGYKLPRVMTLVPEIPRNATGKAQYPKAKELLLEAQNARGVEA